MAWNNTDLSDYVNDVPEPEKKVYIECKFWGCKTILNQENAKTEDFCCVHQKKVMIMLSEAPRKDQRKEWRYYDKLVSKRRISKGRKDYIDYHRVKEDNDE